MLPIVDVNINFLIIALIWILNVHFCETTDIKHYDPGEWHCVIHDLVRFSNISESELV